MSTTVYKTKRWSLTGRQWLLGLLQAVGAAVIVYLSEIVSQGSLSFDWQEIALIAIAAALPYIGRKLAEPSGVVTVQTGDDVESPKFR